MTKRLIIMRHAKSSWKNPGQRDHQRPLNDRGRRTAPLVGEQLKALNWVPDYLLSSDAQRTRQTWEHLESTLNSEAEIYFTHDLYLGGQGEAFYELSQVPNQYNTVLLLGHNPTWEDMASRLADRYIAMKTADCVLLESRASSWTDITESSEDWELERIIVARSLED